MLWQARIEHVLPALCTAQLLVNHTVSSPQPRRSVKFSLLINENLDWCLALAEHGKE